MNNVPTMFFTPNQEEYVNAMDLESGMKQELVCSFSFQALSKFDLMRADSKYTPLIISINYTDDKGRNNAYIDYFVFSEDFGGKIVSARSFKQLVLVNGMPFQIKSIFGLAKPDELEPEAVEVLG